MSNYWDALMTDDAHAAEYMLTYGEGPGFETRHALGSFINNGESVLDVGCGPGWNLDHFMEYGPLIGDYKGLDYSERFIRVANDRYINKLVTEWHYYPGTFIKKYWDASEFAKLNTSNGGIPGLYSLGDVRDIKEADTSWDVVILQDCLEHTNGYEKPVREAIRVARKRVLITFWHLEGNNGTEHINDDGDDGYGAWYDKIKWELFLNDLPYVWFETEVKPEGKSHIWNFYIIDKEAK